MDTNDNNELVDVDIHITKKDYHSNERLLFEILNDAYPGKWQMLYKGVEGRKIEFDCANVTDKIAVEIDGGLYPFWVTIKGKRVKVMRGGHSSPEGIMKDMERSNAAQIQGWTVLRYTSDTLKRFPWKIIEDIRELCGYVDGAQQTLSLDGLKQQTISPVQVKLGV